MLRSPPLAFDTRMKAPHRFGQTSGGRIEDPLTAGAADLATRAPR